MTGFIVTAVAAYLLGSVPTGFLVAKARGIDIRTVGSGNIGATNAMRALGKTAGLMVLLADVFKGWVSVWVISRAACRWLAPEVDAAGREMFQIVAAVSAVVGHNYTVWLRFKGGKGIATSAGALLALVPMTLFVSVAIWLIVLAWSRYVSLASICAAGSLPILVWFTGGSRRLIIAAGMLAVLAIYRHRSNIERLLKGAENRFGSKGPSTPERSLHQP